MHEKGNGGRNRQAATFKLRFTAAAKLIAIIFSSLICIMPKITKSEQQAVLASVMELYFATSLAVQEDPDLLDESSDSDSDDGLLVEGGGDSEVFEALSFQTMQDAAQVLGDGWRGPYGQKGKSNWFPTSLSWPAREFRRTYRYESC